MSTQIKENWADFESIFKRHYAVPGKEKKVTEHLDFFFFAILNTALRYNWPLPLVLTYVLFMFLFLAKFVICVFICSCTFWMF